MFPTVVFGVSLFGLVALFFCKSLELSRNIATPLQSIRRAVDPILTDGWAYYSVLCRKMIRFAIHTTTAWINMGIRKIAVVFDTTVHTVATKLNRYLRTRRLHIRHGSEVSAHLRTVLEKTKQDTERPDSL